MGLKTGGLYAGGFKGYKKKRFEMSTYHLGPNSVFVRVFVKKYFHEALFSLFRLGK